MGEGQKKWGQFGIILRKRAFSIDPFESSQIFVT